MPDALSSQDQVARWPEARDEVLKIRVIVWALHSIDVVEGVFGVKFRFTLYWRPRNPERCVSTLARDGAWALNGRTLAVWTATADASSDHEISSHEEPVPPVSMLNATEFGK